MSFRVVAKVLRHSEETLARRLILIVLAEAASDDGIAWIDQDTIAAKSRIAISHVKRCVREMEADGAIESRKAQRGRRRINVYRVLLDGLDEPDYDRLPFTLDRPFTTSEIQTSSPAHDVGSTLSTTSDLRRIPEVSPLMDPSGDPSGAIAPEPEVPKLLKVGGRNLGFDALAEVCGVDPRGNRVGQVAAALNGSARHQIPAGIRELCWRHFGDLVGEDAPEAFERYVAIRVREAAASYRRAMPGAILTPTALAKWWTDLESVQAQSDPAAEQLREAAELRSQGR